MMTIDLPVTYVGNITSFCWRFNEKHFGRFQSTKYTLPNWLVGGSATIMLQLYGAVVSCYNLKQILALSPDSYCMLSCSKFCFFIWFSHQRQEPFSSVIASFYFLSVKHKGFFSPKRKGLWWFNYVERPTADVIVCTSADDLTYHR